MKNYDLNLNSRFDFAISTVEKIKQQQPSAKNVFDIGSGNELLKKRVEALGMNYYSFDLFPSNQNVRKWNIEELFPYGDLKADIIIFLEVIEHLNNPWICIKNIAFVLESNGYLVLSTPNPSWSGSRLHLLGKGFLGMFTEEDLSLNHHVFIAWQHIVKYLLEDNGFVNINIKTLGKETSLTAYPFWGIKLPFRLLFRFAKKIIEKYDPQSIGALYGVVAQKNN